jgi:hypothetical protein
MRTIYLDTETSGLDLFNHEVYEVGCIVRDENETTQSADIEHHWFLPMFQFQNADPFALDIGRFWERYVWPDPKQYTDDFMSEWCRMWCQLTKGAFIVGACVDFDVYRLDLLCRKYGYRMFHNYHLVDVENLCAGFLGIPPPWKSADVYEAMNYFPVEEDKHTALGDARACRDIYDMLMKGR